jgi:hypothetical protein
MAQSQKQADSNRDGQEMGRLAINDFGMDKKILLFFSR